jgi:hypothetical protein
MSSNPARLSPPVAAKIVLEPGAGEFPNGRRRPCSALISSRSRSMRWMSRLTSSRLALSTFCCAMPTGFSA